MEVNYHWIKSQKLNDISPDLNGLPRALEDEWKGPTSCWIIGRISIPGEKRENPKATEKRPLN